MVNDKIKQRDNKVLNDAIADQKNGEAVIIRCPKCKGQTFVGVA
jgi:hypothetical protein